MDFRTLRYFVTIVEQGSMKRAADALYVAQPALSQQVKKLETAIQQPLLVRGSRGISLTSQGERLLAHAQKILRAHDEAIVAVLTRPG